MDHLPTRQSLLLLSSPPCPLTLAALEATYRPTLNQVLSAARCPADQVILLVVIPVSKNSLLSWSDGQSILAGVYSIISVFCAQNGIPYELDGGPGAIDSRVLLIHSRQPPLPLSPAIVDIHTLASAGNHFHNIFFADDAIASSLLQTYRCLTPEPENGPPSYQVIPVATEPGARSNNEFSGSNAMASDKSYSIMCLGGTFDHLHPGHKLMLSATAALLALPSSDSSEPCTLIVGVTGDEMLKNKKFADLVQPWSVRAEAVIEFLSTVFDAVATRPKTPLGLLRHALGGQRQIAASFRNGAVQVECVEFQDVFGPTITRQDIGALVVSHETKSGGAAVNEKRRSLGWRELDIYVVDVLDANSLDLRSEANMNGFSSKVSSTAIRQRIAEALPQPSANG